MEKTISQFIGHVAMLKISDGTFSHGQLHQISTSSKKTLDEKISFQITSVLSPLFFWGRGDSLRETINNFLAECDENGRVAFIEPVIFNLIIEHENSLIHKN